MRDTDEPDQERGPFRVAARWRRGLRSRLRSEQDAAEPHVARRRIAAWAMLVGLVIGFIDLTLPLEDTFRAIRAEVRSHPADQQVVVVAIDDRTLNALGADEPSRSADARLLDRLFAQGADRVFFARAYADLTEPEEDAQFARALGRHAPGVYIGGTPKIEQSDGSISSILPNARFRNSAQIVSMYGETAPFELSSRFPTSSEILGENRPSFSAELARLDFEGGAYRPDFAIDHTTIPTISYIDALQGKMGAEAVRGKDVVIAPASRASRDLNPMPFGDLVPTAYFHVIGAETLKRGYPLDLGWFPAFLIVCGVIILASRQAVPARPLIVSAAVALALIPLALDFVNISVDVMPAAICLAIASFRLYRLAQRTYRGSTGLRRIETLHGSQPAGSVDVLALKIRNFATISAILSPFEIEQLLIKAHTMLRATDSSAQFAFHKDTFVWTRARTPAADLADHAQGLHALFRTSITVGSQAPDIASSIGIDSNYEARLRERTENAMQCAEDAARAGRVFLVSEMRVADDIAWRGQMLSELETALRNDEVGVAFQPKVSLSTGLIVGAEALLRWTHPTRGKIEPAKVVALAEEHGRVGMITFFVLNHALVQARRALDRFPYFRIAINISALDLRDRLFVPQLEQIIAAHRFPVANIILEITETAPIENDEAVSRTMQELKRMGIKLSVDDFGMGHASLEYLRRIPADEVKIDRSFVSGIATCEEDRALVGSAIQMIHSLGRTAVAEGVETARVVELLREMGCEEAQGYHFSHPVAMDDLLAQMPRGAAAA
jgi:EAL domain-containing protein (putative c-di-GMP-specific phosphodiesterase class I)/CHASE2 domain-containing sensor protein